MASFLGGFRGSMNPYSAGMQSAMGSTHDGESQNMLQSAVGALTSIVTPFLGNFASGYAGQEAGKLGVSNEASRAASSEALSNPNITPPNADMGPINLARRVGAASLAVPLAVLDTGYHGLNTVVGGTVFFVGDYAPWNAAARTAAGNNRYINPLYRDGFQLSDIPETYRKFWGNERPMMGRNGLPVLDADGRPVMENDAPTAGQAISEVAGVLGINVLDSILPADVQKNIDKAVEEDTLRAVSDPLNERGLFSWMSGLHSQFDFLNMQERESAFNQGLGRWTSGSADAAIQWFLAPEVLGLKAAGMAGRSLFLKSIKELGDIEAARSSLDLHRAYLAGEQGGMKTPFGSLVESLAKMDELRISRHPIAKTSNDPSLVARTFGSATTFDEVGDRFLALSGDLQAIDRLFAKEPVLGDAMRVAAENRAEAQKTVDYWTTFAGMGESPVPLIGFPGSTSVSQGAEGATDAFFGSFVKQYQAQAERMDAVLQQAVKENRSLESALAGFNKEAGLPDTVRFGEIKLSSLPFGPNSVSQMERKAASEVDRITGKHLWKTQEFKTGGSFGRTVRVWQSAYDYMKTYRIRGFARLDDPHDVMAEIDSTLMTTPMMRALQKQYGAETRLPGTDMLVTDFREQVYRSLVAARTPTERMGVLDKFERDMWDALTANYNLNPADAARLLEKYKGLRQVVVETAKARGFIPDNGEINIIPEMQSLLAQGMPTMDFHYIESLFRLERGSGISRGRDWASIKGSRGLAAFDSLWRPLVLMRLGYTARNVAEGGLRELALFGTIGAWTETDMGTRAIAGNAFSRWAAGSGRQLDRVTSLRYGSLRKARQNLEASQYLTTENLRKVKQLQEEQDAVAGRLTAMADGADNKARKQLLLETRDEFRARVSNTWDEITTEAHGEMDAIVRQAQEMIVPADLVRPIFGSGSRRSNTATGFANPEEARLRQVHASGARFGGNASANRVLPLDTTEKVAENGYLIDEKISRFLNEEERNQFEEITNLRADGTHQDWHEELYWELIHRATSRAIREGMRNGDTVLRTVDPSHDLYQVVHSPADVMADDIASGNMAFLPKENWNDIKYVRANVYGGVADLRVANKSIPKLSDNPNFLEVDPILSQLGLPPSKSLERDLAMIDKIIKLAESDPEIADALRLRAMLSGAPQDLIDYATENGLLLSNKKLKNLTSRLASGEKLLDTENRAHSYALSQFKSDLKDPEYYKTLPEFDQFTTNSVTHGGTRIPGDQLTADPINTSRNVTNLGGIGYYTTADPTKSGGGYLISMGMSGDNRNPVFYLSTLPAFAKSRFLDLDAKITNSTEEGWAAQEQMKRIFAHMLESYSGRPVDMSSAKFQSEWFRMKNDFAFSMDQETTEPGVMTVTGMRRGMAKYFDDLVNVDSNYADEGTYGSQMLFVNAARSEGYMGLRHTGGKVTGGEEHEVYIWYDAPKLTPIESVTQRAMDIMAMKDRWQKILEKVVENRTLKSDMNRMTPWDGKSFNGGFMSEKNKAILMAYMKDRGIGRVLLDDAYSPSGYQMLTSPDMMSVSTDQVDAVIPGRLVGKDYVDNKLEQLTQDAIVRNPAVLKSGQLDDAEILRLANEDQDVLAALRGTEKNPSAATKAKIARMLEVNDFTHAQIGPADSNTFTNVSELVGSREAGSAYGAAMGMSNVQQRANLILANDDRFGKLMQDWHEYERATRDAESRYSQQFENNAELLSKFRKRLGKRASGDPVKAPLGSGMETFEGRFKKFETEGPFNVNNQGSYNASLVSSGDTMLANLYGFTDYAMLSLRKSQTVVPFHPGEAHYFDALAEQLNKYYRNDFVGMAIIRGDSDGAIIDSLFNTKQGRTYLRDIEEFKSFRGHIDPERLSEDARADMVDIITQRRENFNKLVPDADLRAHLVDNEVRPDYLQSELGWRGDLQDVVGHTMIDNGQSQVRKLTGRIMTVLGTMPENALIRHPFFRARWREEMQRQADLYASQGVTEFGDAEINAMNQIAKKFALRQTNETLYTIQRLSTPAHIFKFVMPFFPAWASAMRFWMLQIPARRPEYVARYALAFNAPESAGWVYDDQGNKVKGKDNILGKLGDKVFGGSSGNIVINVTNPVLREKLAAVTGGNTDIKIAKGGLDFMLQGEDFWFPGLAPLVAIPASWLAAQRPDIATALETGHVKAIPFFGDLIPQAADDFISSRGLTRPFYRAAVPFGRPTQEKDVIDVVASYVAPAALDKFLTGFRGMSSAEFANAAKEIHRTNMTEWDLNGRQGKEPDFFDAVDKTKVLYGFRGAMSLTMPFPTQFQTRYQFYIDEARRIDREVGNIGGTYDDANKEFLRLYGPSFFSYKESLSAGGSGMSSTVGEYNEFNRDLKLMGDLASIGPDASFITMATRPFAKSLNKDGYDGAVYSWQMNQMIQGALGKFLRGGQQTELPTTKADRELGWMYFQDMSDKLDAIAASKGTTVQADQSLSAVKKQMAEQIGQKYNDWYIDYQDKGGARYIRSNQALQDMVDAGYFEAHKDLPYAKALFSFYEGRKKFASILESLGASGGSSNIKAKSNQALFTAYASWVDGLKLSDPSGNFSNTWERFFSSDPLNTIPEFKDSNG